MTGPAVTSASAPTGRRTPASRTPAPRRRGRWIAIVAVSLLLHLTLLDLLPWSLAPDDEPNDAPLHVVLMPPIRPVEAPIVPVAPIAPTPSKQAPASLPPRTRPPKTIAPTFVPESMDEVPQVQLAAPAPSGAQPASPAAAPLAAAPAPPSPEPATTAPPPIAAPPVTATAPQSALLRYKVLYIDNKNFNAVHYYGVGSIDWSTADGRYRSELEAAVDLPFFKLRLLTSHSEGSFAPAGLAPDRYTETQGKRATVATNFNRDARQSITFSASSATVPLLPGAQDRLSVLFQIGGLLLADPDPPSPGRRFAIPVAGVRGEVETWLFETLGIEPVDAAGTTLETTHLRYVPRAASNDRTIDVWVARNDGYPARVLYTEPNGNTTEMTLDEIGTVR